jgi:predicted house-cleaning noncanonical NTP pyrophosphatase (MazG superfamily)
MKNEQTLIADVIKAIAAKQKADDRIATTVRDLLVFAVAKNNFRPIQQVMPTLMKSLPETGRKVFALFDFVIARDAVAECGVKWKKGVVSDEAMRTATVEKLKGVDCRITEKAKAPTKKAAKKTYAENLSEKLEGVAEWLEKQAGDKNKDLASVLKAYAGAAGADSGVLATVSASEKAANEQAAKQMASLKDQATTAQLSVESAAAQTANLRGQLAAQEAAYLAMRDEKEAAIRALETKLADVVARLAIVEQAAVDAGVNLPEGKTAKQLQAALPVAMAIAKPAKRKPAASKPAQGELVA